MRAGGGNLYLISNVSSFDLHDFTSNIFKIDDFIADTTFAINNPVPNDFAARPL